MRTTKRFLPLLNPWNWAKALMQAIIVVFCVTFIWTGMPTLLGTILIVLLFAMRMIGYIKTDDELDDLGYYAPEDR